VQKLVIPTEIACRGGTSMHIRQSCDRLRYNMIHGVFRSTIQALDIYPGSGIYVDLQTGYYRPMPSRIVMKDTATGTAPYGQ
jgi:hypothetical protein